MVAATAPRPRETFIESRTTPGVFYRILGWRGIYECDCPARVECWHIKEQRSQDAQERAYLEGIRAMAEVTSRGLVPVKPQMQAVELASTARLIDQESFGLMVAIAKTAAKAGQTMLPDYIKSEEQAMAVMLGGWEWGFSPFTALRLVFPVNGKLNVMTEGYMALVRRRGGRFIFHEISDMAAEVELVIGGESRIRVRYSESERLRAGQGMKKGGPNAKLRKWLPVYEEDGRTQKKHPQGHKNAGQGVVKLNPAWSEEADATAEWIEDPESPWTKYRADMFAWAACKRCIKFGASDFIDLAPIDMAPIEMDEIEESPLTRAMFAGEWRPAALEDDPDETQYDGGDWHDESPEEPDDEPLTDEPESASTFESASEDEKQEPLSLEDAKAAIVALLETVKTSRNYLVFYKPLSKFMPDGNSQFNPEGLLDAAVANECLAALRSSIALAK